MLTWPRPVRTRSSWRLASYLRTYLIQLVAAAPLTFALFDPAHIARSADVTLVARPVVGYGLGLAIAALSVLVLRPRTEDASESVIGSDGYLDAGVVGGLCYGFWPRR